MKLGFVSLGCPKNLVDGEVMLGLARQAGHEVTADAKDAEVIVVNYLWLSESARIGSTGGSSSDHSTREKWNLRLCHTADL